jgi:hypothetical protein
MSNKNIPSFVTLPVELIHYILDNLDILTILISFRNVCKRFNDIVDNYHRYKVSFTEIEILKRIILILSRHLPY